MDPGASTLTIGTADNGGFDILTFAGQIDGVLVSLNGTPLNPGSGGQLSPLGAFNYDNIVYEESGSTDVLDTLGILVSYAGSPDLEGNIWGNGGTSYSYPTGAGAGTIPSARSARSSHYRAHGPQTDPVPAPMTLALLGSALPDSPWRAAAIPEAAHLLQTARKVRS